MNELKKILLILILTIFTSNSFALINNKGAATNYKITITRLQLCDSTSSTSACNNPVEIFSGDSGAIDIAGTTAGSSAASVGSLATVPFGTEYTFMQITMKRLITVTGTVSDDTNTCVTAGTDDSTPATALAAATSGTAAETDIYIGISTNGNGTGINSTTAGDGTGTAQADATIDNDDLFVEWRQAMTTPITLKVGAIPSVSIAFGTTTAIGYISGGDAQCDTTAGETQGIFGAAPDIDITISY